MAFNDFSLSFGFVLCLTFLVLPISMLWLIRKHTSLATEDVKLASSAPNVVLQYLNQPDHECRVSKVIDTPDGWFSDSKSFELERRAVFSQTWLCITHTSHFQRPGDYLSFKIANFPFFLILGKDNVLRGFHNVCRHRAYNVTRKVMGSSLVLGCKYHGWSYDTKGNLTKAPQFDQLPGFRKEANGLYQIWVRTDPNGFVFINFDAKWNVFDPPTQGLNTFAHHCNASKTSSYLAFWQTEADFNWKQANAMLERSGIPKLEVDSGSFLGGWRRMSWAVPGESKLYFPSSVSALTSIAGLPLWHMTVVEPISATRSSIRRTLYSSQTNVQLPGIEETIAKLKDEFTLTVKRLETEFQSIGIADECIALSPSQEELRVLIQGHVRKEREAGKKITPALPLQIASEVNSSDCGIAEKLCRELDGLADAGAACFKPSSPSQSLAW